jgi:hypothetical protein
MSSNVLRGEKGKLRGRYSAASFQIFHFVVVVVVAVVVVVVVVIMAALNLFLNKIDLSINKIINNNNNRNTKSLHY